MTATSGRTGLGTVLKLGDGESPENFSNVANVVSIEAGGFTLDLVDATHLASSNFLREWLPTLRTAQAWNMTIQYDPTAATHDESTGIKSKQDARSLTTLKVDMTNAGFTKELYAQGYITELGNVSIGVDTLMTQSFTFQPTGNVLLQTPA